MNLSDNHLVPRMLRRVVSVPAMIGASTVYFLTLPLALSIAILNDAMRSNCYATTRALLFFGLYFICEIGGIILASILWLALAGGILGGPRIYLDAHYGLQRIWASFLFEGAVKIFGMKVAPFQTPGKTGNTGQPIVMLVRHASTADTVLAAALVNREHRIRFRYVLKSELLWDPCLDIVGNRLPNVFVDRFTRDMDTQVQMIQSLASHMGPGDGFLIYPEGTRYTPIKFQIALERLKARGQQQLAQKSEHYQHVLPPRPRGTLAALESCKNATVWVLAHTGFEGARSFREFWHGGLIGKTIHIKISQYKVPAQGASIDWLYSLWDDLDMWLSTHAGIENESPY